MNKKNSAAKCLSFLVVMCLAFTGVFVAVAAGTPVLAVSAALGGTALEGDPFAFRSKSARLSMQGEVSAYPDSFDLRNVDTDDDGVGDTSYVTPVKLQNPYGTCWGFAAAAAAESSLLSSGLAAEDGFDVNTLDLSEKHLAYFTTSYLDDEDDPQNGEGMHFYNLTKEDLKTSAYRYNTGGWTIYATSLFSSGIGPIVENSEDVSAYRGANGKKNYRNSATAYDPEGNPVAYSKEAVWYDDHDDWSMPDDYRFYQSYRLKDSFCLPSPAGQDDEGEYEYNPDGVNAIKQQMYDHHRAVSINFTAESYLPGQDTSGKLYMSSNWAHYTYEDGGANHAVTVVGWDDNYPKENFLEGHQPPADGAFLIKNSWGSELNEFPNNGYRHWGLLEGQDSVPYDKDAKASSDRATGYFWISYYDRSLEDPEAFEFDKLTGENGYYVEQHDLMQACNYSGVEETDDKLKMANVFTAEASSKLSEISVMTLVPETKVSYQVYLLGDDFADPQDGLLMTSGEAEYEMGGYHKIALNDTKTIAEGQKFSVIVQEQYDERTYAPFACGFGKEESEEGMEGYYNEAVINEKESFLYEKKWTDLSDESLRQDMLGVYSDFFVMDNFPVKAYLEPVTYDDAGEERVFEGYLTANNYQQGRITTLNFLTDDSIKVAPEFRGIAEAMPESWNPEIRWVNSDPSVVEIEEYGDESVLITGKAEGRAYITLDAGEYGLRVITVTVRKPALTMMALSENGLEMVYTGKELTPKPMFICNDKSEERDASYYVEGVDYVLSYENNVNVGTATVTATGIGQYGGSVSDTFTITKAENTMKASGKKATVKQKNKNQKLRRSSVIKVKDAKGAVTYTKLSGNKKIKINKSSGKVTIKKGLKKGRYKVKAKVNAAGTDHYKAKTETVTFVIKIK